MQYLSILTKKAVLTKFEHKVKDLAIKKGGKLPDIVDALAEFDWGNPRMAEKAKSDYMDLMTSGKNADKQWAKRVSEIINKVHAELKKSVTSQERDRIVSRKFGYKKEPFVIIANQIDGFIGVADFNPFDTQEEALTFWEKEVIPAAKAGEWDCTLFACSPNSKVIEKYGYYLVMSSAKKIKELTYMD